MFQQQGSPFAVFWSGCVNAMQPRPPVIAASAFHMASQDSLLPVAAVGVCSASGGPVPWMELGEGFAVRELSTVSYPDLAR